jgi:hypothetical protein
MYEGIQRKLTVCGVFDTERKNRAFSVIDTACTIDEGFVRPWQHLKGIHVPIKNVYEREMSTLQKYINLTWLPNTKHFRACGVIDTGCTIFAHENRSYLGEFEAEFKKARESGAHGELFQEKKTKVENLVTLFL